MGCVSSRTDINDLHANVFQVMNVDDLGNLITPGKLEVTESDIILHQRNKPPVKWPLRCLRRYGYDAEIFSFESGRRCSTGPGIYAFKCRRAAQLFNLVQTNIQQVCTNGDDAISRDMPNSAQSGPTLTRVTIPTEPNYLDPTPARTNGRVVSTFPHSQQNGIGRLSSIGSSSGPLSPQGTMGSPSPPPVLPLSLPPPPPPAAATTAPPPPHFHPSQSLYVNEEAAVQQQTSLADAEHNNNKSLTRRSMQRSHTVSSSNSSSGFLSFEQQQQQQTSSQVISSSSEMWSSAHRVSLPPQSSSAAAPAYMNVDLGSDASPLSPSHSASCDFSAAATTTPLKEDAPDSSMESSARAYMNISPGQENVEQPVAPPVVKARPPALTSAQQQQQQQNEPDDEPKHCYANLEASEIEGLKKRFSATSFAAEKLALQTPPPPPLCSSSGNAIVREVSYAVLDLNTKEAASGGTTTTTTTLATMTTSTAASATVVTAATTTATATAASATPMYDAAAAESNPKTTTTPPPDSPTIPPLKSQQVGYVTIDFNRTAALSHSVNSSLVNDIDEGSRKTRHNSTISELVAPVASTRLLHNSSMSE